MSDETRNDEIRNEWFRNLVKALDESNESAQTDAERELIEVLAFAIKDNVEPVRKEGAKNE